jgi:pimeloyl-ACP methyl ester carboxylesterase
MKEQVCNFGTNGHLLGILTTPDANVRVEGAPIALILNAGIVHRIGPFRLNVDIARHLAELGFSTLRMDLSGLGDSGPRTGKLELENRAELDAADAMTFLQRETGVNDFVIVGLCSGAYNAHCVAVKDHRVVGGVFMDGIVFRTFGYFLRHHLARVFRPRFWRNAIKRRLYRPTFTTSEADGNALAESEFFGGDLSKDKVVNDLSGLMDRGVQMLFLYTDGYDDICGRSQFKEMYGLRPDEGQLQVEYYPKSEHTFRLIENRKAACERVSKWFQNRFGAKVTSATNA